LDELFEALTWSQLGLHAKPIGLLDVEGYYQPLLAFLDHAVTERLLRSEQRNSLLVAQTPAALLAALRAYRHTPVVTWLDQPPTAAGPAQ